jgi:hypothetical protein
MEKDSSFPLAQKLEYIIESFWILQGLFQIINYSGDSLPLSDAKDLVSFPRFSDQVKCLLEIAIRQ